MSRPIAYLSHAAYGAIGLVSALFFVFCAVAAWMSGQGAVSPFFLMFVALGTYVWLSAGETEINELQIRHRSIFGTHSIRWDEVVVVEVDSQGQVFVFKGAGKRLVVPGILTWPRRLRATAMALLDEQIEQRQIEVRESVWAAYKRSKNTREPL